MARLPMTTPPEESDRERLLRGLDRAETVAIHVYRGALVGLVLLVTVVLVGLVNHLPAGFSQGEWFYLTVALLVFTGWIVAQFRSLAERERRSRHAARVRAGSGTAGAHARSFTVDSARAEAASEVSTSLAAEDQLDAEHTARATALCTVGHDLDQVCRVINPRYASWDAGRQDSYREYVRKMVDARRVS
jgi:hypothetical protein